MQFLNKRLAQGFGLFRWGLIMVSGIFVLSAGEIGKAHAQNLPPGIYTETKEDGSSRRNMSPQGNRVPSGANYYQFKTCKGPETFEAAPLPRQSPPIAHFIATFPCYCSGVDPTSAFNQMGQAIRRYGFGQAFPNSATRANIREMADVIANGGANHPKASDFLKNLGLYSPFYFTIDPRIGERKWKTYYCVNGSDLQTWLNALQADARRILNR